MSLFDVLPGIELPVGEISPTLSDMWAVERDDGGEFRASQMNLILHFGIKTTDEEAGRHFHTAIRFAQRYPCRIIVLCPLEKPDGEERLKAKLFTQCYIGASLREMCCCEALMLSYATREFMHLRNQVSVWLEADLPTYHWFHRVPRERIVTQYLDFIHSFRRILYDSAVEGTAYDGIEWPNPKRVVDIAMARLLPVKQALGPFLAGFPPPVLVKGLERMELGFHPDFQAEGRWFKRWILSSLGDCFEEDGKRSVEALDCVENPLDPGDPACMTMKWTGGGQTLMGWKLGRDGHAEIEAHWRSAPLRRVQMIEWIEPEVALSESIFF